MYEKIITMLANLTVSVFLGRHLGPELFGEFSYIIAIGVIVSPLAALGLNAIVTRELINSPHDTSKVMSTALFLRMIGALGGSVFCATLVLADIGISSREGLYALLFVAFGNLFTSFTVIEFWFQSKVKAKIVAKMRSMIIIMFSSLKLGVLYFTRDISLIAFVFALETVFIGVGFFYIAKKESINISLGFVNFEYGKSLLKQSIWLFFSSLAAIVYLKIDQIMLANMVGLSEVGVYSVASRISEVWYFFSNALVISIFPSLLLLKNNGNKEKYTNRIQGTSDLLCYSAVVLVIVMLFSSEYIIDLLYGVEYKESYIILNIHIFASIFVFMRSLVSKWIIAEGLLKYSLLSQGVGAIMNILANIVLIPEYGGVGAAIATLISYIGASYLVFCFSSKTRPIFWVMSRSLFLPLRLVRLISLKFKFTK